MSALETWIRAQTGSVREDGTHAATITLEGPDGTTWGTWPAKPNSGEELTQTIIGAVRLTEEELPSGRHRGKVIAVDSGGSQLAVLPLTMTGRSSVAAAAATEARAMQQAVAIMVQNAEAVTAGLRSENERLSERNNELLDNLSRMVEQTLSFQQAAASWSAEAEAIKARTARIDAIAEQAKPLLEIGMAIAAEELAAWIERLKNDRQKRELAARQPATESNSLPPPPQGPPLDCRASDPGDSGRHGSGPHARPASVAGPSSGEPAPTSDDDGSDRSGCDRSDGEGDGNPRPRRRAASGKRPKPGGIPAQATDRKPTA